MIFFFLLVPNFPLPRLVLELTRLWSDKSKCCSAWCIAVTRQSIKSLQYHSCVGAHSISTPPQKAAARLYNQRGNRGITNLVTWLSSQNQMEAPSVRLQNLCPAQNCCLFRDLLLRSYLGGLCWLLRRGELFQLILVRTPRLLRGDIVPRTRDTWRRALRCPTGIQRPLFARQGCGEPGVECSEVEMGEM